MLDSALQIPKLNWDCAEFSVGNYESFLDSLSHQLGDVSLFSLCTIIMFLNKGFVDYFLGFIACCCEPPRIIMYNYV